MNKLGLSTKNAEGAAAFELEELKLLEKKSMGCGSRICFSKTFISSTGHRQHEAPNKSPERWMNRRDTGEKEAGDPLLFPAEQRWMTKRCRKKPPRNFTLLSPCFLYFEKEKPGSVKVQYSIVKVERWRRTARRGCAQSIKLTHSIHSAHHPTRLNQFQ